MIKIGVISILIIIPSLIFSTTKVGVTVGGDFVIDNGLIGLLQANLSNDQQNNINQMLSAGDNQSWMTNSYPSLQCWNLAFGITIWPEYETGWYYQYRLNYSILVVSKLRYNINTF